MPVMHPQRIHHKPKLTISPPRTRPPNQTRNPPPRPILLQQRPVLLVIIQALKLRRRLALNPLPLLPLLRPAPVHLIIPQPVLVRSEHLLSRRAAPARALSGAASIGVGIGIGTSTSVRSAL